MESKDGASLRIFLPPRQDPVSREALPLKVGQEKEKCSSGWRGGKSDPEIGIILGISARTTNKHAEHIFRALEVESRHAATLVALELLGQT